MISAELYGDLMSGDLMFLYPFEGWIGALICVDVATHKTYVRKIRSKKTSEIKKHFESIFEQAEVPFKIGMYVHTIRLYKKSGLPFTSRARQGRRVQFSHNECLFSELKYNHKL